MIYDQFAIAILKELSKIGILGIGDGLHKVSLTGIEVVDIIINPVKFREHTVGSRLVLVIADVRNCATWILFVKQVVHVITSHAHQF